MVEKKMYNLSTYIKGIKSQCNKLYLKKKEKLQQFYYCIK